MGSQLENYQEELQRRLLILEQPQNQGPGFRARDWTWLIILGVLFPVVLLIWGAM